jgi:hypothetical protein
MKPQSFELTGFGLSPHSSRSITGLDTTDSIAATAIGYWARALKNYKNNSQNNNSREQYYEYSVARSTARSVSMMYRLQKPY